MGWKDKLKKLVEEASQEIEEKTSDKLMEEELNPTLRKHHGEPMKKNEDKK